MLDRNMLNNDIMYISWKMRTLLDSDDVQLNKNTTYGL